MATAMDQFWLLPPVSRTITALTAVQSLAVHGGLLGFHRVVFYYPWLVKFPPEIWRIITPFFVTSGGIGMLFDMFFLWTYSSGLETQSPRFTQPGDYLTFLAFVSTIILLLAGFLLSTPILLSPLTLSLAYIFSLDNRNRRVTFIIFQIPAQYLPYAMLAIALVMGGPYHALCEATGLLAAHLFDFLTRIYPTFQGGRNVLKTPTLIRNWFGGNQASWTQRTYGSAYQPVTRQNQQGGGQAGGAGGGAGGAASSGWSNPLAGSWRNRGTGRRLGGE